MANNPETYAYRVALKECFSVISDCRRIALRSLPVNFFVVMFNDMVTAMLDEHDTYSDIILQARTYIQSNRTVDPQFIDATMDIFDNTLKKFNIDDPGVSKVYREFLTKTKYVGNYIYWTLNKIKHLQ